MSKMGTKLLSLVLAGCLMSSVTVFAGDTNAETSEPYTITLMTHYNNESEKAPVDAAIAQLKEEFPHVTIEPEGYVNDDGASFKARVASGDLPDLFEAATDMMDILLKTEQIVCLDEYAEKYNLQDLLLPWTWENGLKYTDGKIYGLPPYSNMYGTLFYNKQVFEENNVKVPANYDELLQAIEAFNEKGIVPIALAGKVPFINGILLDMFAQRINPEGIYGLSTGSAKPADYLEAVKKVENLVKVGAFQKGAATVDYDPARAIFHAGEAAMFFCGDWEVTEGLPDLGENLEYFTEFPVMNADEEYTNEFVMPGGDVPNAGGGGGLVMNAKVENPDEVAEVLFRYYELVQQYSYTDFQAITTTIKTDELTTKEPMPELATKYLDDKANFSTVGSCWEHSIPNKDIQAGLGEELQKLIAGESAEEFVANLEKIVEDATK